ncbi:hypothetical protein FN846DRAFT_904495 [Sphaerosporella brunnea]|uniref:Uncharacterized protein n=1 Tax=Sphaerosporella brunnea TaxID=1250544 RepID=A0A5J5F4D9_9PEZI|nr:hypothetical protein FN846DRAFT_904495 [Sphaerosporella brunnea]
MSHSHLSSVGSAESRYSSATVASPIIKWGQLLAYTLGRTGIAAAEFKAIAKDVQPLCPIYLAVNHRRWASFDDVEKEIYLNRERRAYHVFRNAVVLIDFPFVEHILCVGKSEAKRRITKARRRKRAPGYPCEITIQWTGDIEFPRTAKKALNRGAMGQSGNAKYHFCGAGERGLSLTVSLCVRIKDERYGKKKK